MAYLQNCLPIQKYEAEEFPGDSIIAQGTGVQAMELQTPPTDSTFEQGQDPTMSLYYLVIESMPGYNIQANMINIGGVLGDNSSDAGTDSDTWQWSSEMIPPNNSTLPPEVDQVFGIRAKNSNVDNPSSCDNKVIVRVSMPFTFVMPAYDVTVNIDFGGTAVECSPYITPEISDNLAMAFLDYRIIIGNGVNANPDCNIFIAKYYENMDYAASPFDLYNQQAAGSGAFAPTVLAGYYNWINENSEFFTGNPSALEGFQPTYYNVALNLSPASELWNLDNTNNITTECGQLIYRQTAGVASQPQLPIEHPNYSENPQHAIHRMDYRYIFFPSASSAIAYLDDVAVGNYTNQTIIESHPFLTPGDGLLPSSLCWYISVGDNEDYELMPESVDVYKIISAKGYSSGALNAPVDSAPCPVEGYDYEQLLISEKTNGVTIQNNSNLNIDNIECVTVEGSNNKTVKLTVNFQANYQENIWTLTSNVAPNGAVPLYMTRNEHKIFVNVYPNEI